MTGVQTCALPIYIWDKVFKISERGSSVLRELFAGATTFLCVSYVLAVNPAILGAAGMDVGAVFTATAVSAIIMTLLLALYSNMPFAGLSGMGINAFFAYTIVVQMGHSFAFALTAQLIAGLAFLLDRKSTRLNSSHRSLSRMPSSA